MLDIPALKALAEAATPGPWEAEWCVKHDGIHMQNPDGGTGLFIRDDTEEDNIPYIAAANPTTVLALIARIDVLESALLDAIEVFGITPDTQFAKAYASCIARAHAAKVGDSDD